MLQRAALTASLAPCAQSTAQGSLDRFNDGETIASIAANGRVKPIQVRAQAQQTGCWLCHGLTR